MLYIFSFGSIILVLLLTHLFLLMSHFLILLIQILLIHNSLTLSLPAYKPTCLKILKCFEQTFEIMS